MPVFPLAWEAIIPHGDYPAMTKHDTAIWERFLEQWGGNFQQVAYNVALGGVVHQGLDVDEAQARMWRYATAVKLDAVLLSEEHAWAVEVKPRASLSAIGQALGGAVMLEADGHVPRAIIPLVVTDACSQDAVFVAEELGVVLVQVGHPPVPDATAALRAAEPA